MYKCRFSFLLFPCIRDGKDNEMIWPDIILPRLVGRRSEALALPCVDFWHWGTSKLNQEQFSTLVVQLERTSALDFRERRCGEALPGVALKSFRLDIACTTLRSLPLHVKVNFHLFWCGPKWLMTWNKFQQKNMTRLEEYPKKINGVADEHQCPGFVPEIFNGIYQWSIFATPA